MEFNWTLVKSIILSVIFVIVGVVTYASMDITAQEEMVTTFKASSMPILYMVTENNRLINPAHGYTQDVGEKNVFNGITPIYEDRSVNIALYNYGERITGISYQVRDIENSQLLEDTQLKLSMNQEDYTMATFNIKNLIEKDKEYFLTVSVSTDKNEQIRYYERIVWTDNLKLKEKLDFVLGFNSYTYSREKIDEIGKWIETDETGDNTNFGYVNIKSTKKQIGWGDLSARIEGNVIPTIWEMTPSSAQISLSYRVVTSSKTTDYDAYTVKDYYRLRQTSDTIYLMDYERKVNQIFDAYNDLQSNGRINLGIKSSLSDKVESRADKSGKYSYFVQNGNLWCYNRNLNCFTNVFSFTSSSDYNGRPIWDEHSIKIIDVDSVGNCWFSVCGYMNGGEHNGQTGLSLFYYNYDESIVKEQVYIPVNLPYRMIKDNVGDVSYVNEFTYFVKINQYLYSIDLTSGEYMMITDQLYDGTYAINESGTKIAYHDNHTTDECKVIRIYDFETAQEVLVNGASNGGRTSDFIKIIGYIGDDLVYGMANPLDFQEKKELNRIFPMYAIVVINDDNELVKKYQEIGTYVSLAEIEGMRVNLYRVIKNEEGKYEDTSIDQLLNKEENTGSTGTFTEVVATSVREKELYLNIPTTSGDLENVAVKFSKEIQFMEQSLYSFETDYKFKDKYAIYVKGEWVGNSDNLKKSIGIASGGYGYVVGPSGEYIWKKTEGNVTITCNEENVPEDVVKNHELNLSGVSLDNILYYVSIGKIVAGKLGEDKFVYIYDYDKSDIFYYDAALNKSVTLDRDTAGKLFIRYDNIFLVPKQD